jgi:hypothetical protein
MNSDFISPRFEGIRFDDHTIPLELLEDFAAFEEMLIEVAKWLYLQENSNRKRVPNGFTDGFSLKLASISEGSSIANIVMAAPIGLFPTANAHYFEKAKENIVKSIAAAGRNENITEFIPESFLGYFNKIGKNLKDDESIDFLSGNLHNAKLNKDIRKKLILTSSSITEVITQTKVKGFIPVLDKSNNTFTIQLTTGQKLISPIEPQFKKTIFEAFDNYENGLKVIVKGLGKYNKNDRLEGFERIEHITSIDSLDVLERIEEISKLDDGWYNGEGKSLSKEGLEWFAKSFEDNFSLSLKLPYLYPTIQGGIQAEWCSNKFEISLQIDLTERIGDLHLLDLTTDDDSFHRFDFSKINTWAELNSILEAKLLN